MPRYDVECNKCEHSFEAICKVSEIRGVTCERCGFATRVVIKTLPSRDWFRPHWNENFDLNPVYVESKSHMKRLCKQFNVTSRALGDIRNITEI